MKAVTFFLLFCVVSIATGCPQKLIRTKPSTNFSEDQLTSQINDYLKNRQIAYYCAINNKQVGFNYTDLKYTCGDGNVAPAIGEATAKRIRNEAIENGITAVNSVYSEFVDHLHTGRATGNFVADVIDLGLGAAVGITSGERALQILGVSLTAFRGGRKSVDSHFFKEQTMPILINKMDDNRSTVYASMLMKKSKPLDDYSMAEVIRDIVDYYNAGTLVRAITQLSKDTGEKANESAKKVLQLKNADPSMIVAVPFAVVEAGNKFTAFVISTSATLSGDTEKEVKDKITDNLRLIYRDLFAKDALKAKLAAFKIANPALKDNMDKLEKDDKTVPGKDILNILAMFYNSIKNVPADEKLIIEMTKSMEKYPLS